MAVEESTHSIAREEILNFASVNKSVLNSMQRLLHSAARALSVPAAFSAFFDSEGQLSVHTWYGFDATTSPESTFLNSETSFYETLQIIPNTLQLSSFSNDVWVTNGGVRFFASLPIKTSSGALVGVFCVLDSEPRNPTNDQRRLLQDFSQIASETVLLRFETSINRHAYRRIETEYKHYRKHLDRVVSSLPIPLFSVDQEGIVLQWNRACVDTFGYSTQEITGQSALEFLTPSESKERIDKLIKSVYNRRRISGIELLLESKDGTKRFVQGRLFPHFDSRGEVESCVVVIKDYSAYYKSEQELNKTEAHYKEIASDMMRLKTAFLSNMSHEIRTPLTSIIGFADILGEHVDDSNKEFTQLIEESAQKLMSTLNAVLDLAQLEGHSLELNKEKLDLYEHTRSIAESFRTIAEEKELDFTMGDVPTGNTQVFIDPSAQHRITENLISNAVKFTRKGSISISVLPSETEVTLIIKDTGVGISKEFLPHIFEEFLQESTGVSRIYQGSGLGLAITKRLVELMGGTIEVQSKKGQGTTFTVSYPLFTSEALAS